jgi:chromosome segregation ATPase
MSEDPKADIASLLTENGPQAPLHALGLAGEWAAHSLTDEIGEDDVEAFRCVIALDAAFRRVGELLPLLPGIIKLASPGAPVAQRLAEYQERLVRQSEELAGARAELQALSGTSEQIRQAESEAVQLRAQIAELTRKRELVSELPALRAKCEALEAAVAAAGAQDADEIILRMTRALEHLQTLTEGQRALLGSETSTLTTELAASVAGARAEREQLDDLARELKARQAELAELGQERERTLSALEAHRQADQAVADSLAGGDRPAAGPGLEYVRAELADIAERLTDLDRRLEPILRKHAEALQQARQIRSW